MADVRWSINGFLRDYAWLIVLCLIAFAFLALGTRGFGPWGDVDPIRELGVGTKEDLPGANDGGLDGMDDHDSGDCITWDRSADESETRPTSRVDCAEPHLFEVISRVEIDGTAYGPEGPTELDWDQVEKTRCLPRATEYLGYPLDPAGRFATSTIAPRGEGPADDLTLWCGIITVDLLSSSGTTTSTRSSRAG